VFEKKKEFGLIVLILATALMLSRNDINDHDLSLFLECPFA
jgi:hypothetical protein